MRRLCEPLGASAACTCCAKEQGPRTTPFTSKAHYRRCSMQAGSQNKASKSRWVPIAVPMDRWDARMWGPHKRQARLTGALGTVISNLSSASRPQPGKQLSN